MTAERIVRALAAADQYRHTEGTMSRMECHLCGAFRSGRGQAPIPHVSATDHFADCPWRLAVEWVAAQEAAEPGDGVLDGIKAGRATGLHLPVCLVAAPDVVTPIVRGCVEDGGGTVTIDPAMAPGEWALR